MSFRPPFLRWLRPLAGLLLLAVTSSAHDSRYTGLRHAHDLPAALELARSEARHVLVHVEPDGARRGLRWFRWPDPGSGRFMDVLVLETVLCEVDASRTGGFLAALGERGAVPRLVLLDAAGRPLWSSPEVPDLPDFVGAVRGVLYRSEARERVQAWWEGPGREDGLAAERRAAFELAAGRVPAAVVLYEERALAGLELRDPLAAARRNFPLHALVDLAPRSSEARAALARLEGRARALLSDPRTSEPRIGTDLAALLRRLGREVDIVELFLELDPQLRGRHGLVDAAFEELLARGEYAALAQVIQPENAFAGEVEHVRRLSVSRPGLARDGEGRGSAAFAVTRGAGCFELLAALGRDREAIELAEAVLAFEPGALTLTLLGARAVRAKNPNVLAALEARR